MVFTSWITLVEDPILVQKVDFCKTNNQCTLYIQNHKIQFPHDKQKVSHP